MLKIWFMYDNHCFAQVKQRDRAGLIRRATELFEDDHYGSLFVRDEFDAIMRSFDLNGSGKPPSAKAIGEWADKVVAEESFRHRMHA